MNILVINTGSSSVKYSVFEIPSKKVLISGKIQKIGEEGSSAKTHKEAISQILDEISELKIEAVGHRVVHGGEKFSKATFITEEVEAEIEARVPDAPLHNPYSLEAIRECKKIFSNLPQVAVFDTAFHANLPKRAKHYAIDLKLAEKHGIRRFGFHGTSHQYVAKRAAEALGRNLSELRLISLHLGNGASACAIEYGHSTETSMGLTPAEGLVMGTRSGDIDAGVLIKLIREAGLDADSLDELLNKKSGLLGISGISKDLREIEKKAEEGDSRARLAINIFAHRARKYIGAYSANMAGVDAVILTGGIGENSKSMRRRILQRLDFLGLSFDEDKNEDAKLSADSDYAFLTSNNSTSKALVIKTNEELMIALGTAAVAKNAKKPRAKKTIPIAISARHAHLDKETFEALFGKGKTPTHLKELSQPKQYACEETVTLIGPRNKIEGVRLLSPLRPKNQIEISRTDEFALGVDAPVRDSGNTKGSAPIIIQGPAGKVNLKEGLICARRHIHMHSDDAKEFGVKDKDEVSVGISGGERDLTFSDVLIRVKDSYKLEMHIDTDEGNAAELSRYSEGDSGGELVYNASKKGEAKISK